MCCQANRKFSEKNAATAKVIKHPSTSFFTLKNPSRPAELDTLAQLTHKPEENLKRKAHRKAMTAYISSQLIKLNSENIQAYRNMYYCNSVLLQENKELTTSYCKNRFCLVCNAIKTANLINGYMPELEKFSDPQFLTLTIKAVNESDLKQAISKMGTTLRKISQNFTKYHRRKIVAIRKLECNFNPKTGTYNPHYHFIIDGIEDAKLLRQAWLHLNPTSRKIAQDIRPADMSSVLEIFKYFTKITAKNNLNFYALDKIYSALRNRRIVQPIGLKKIVIDEDKRDKVEYEQLSEEQATWNWHQENYDWINRETGEILTGFIPNKAFKALLSTDDIDMLKNIELQT